MKSQKKIKFLEAVYDNAIANDIWKKGKEYDVVEETHTYYILQWSNGIKVGIGKELEGKTYELI